MKKKPFWLFNFPDLYELEELEESTIEFVEKILKIEFPKSYLEILKEKNGGMLHIPQEVPNVYPDGGGLQIDYLLGVSQRSYEGILTTNIYVKEWELPENIVIITGDGHWWLVLDYRNHTGNNPPLSLLDSEYGLDIMIAENFSVFLDKLKPLDVVSVLEYLMPEEVYERVQVERAIESKKDVLTMTGGFRYILNKEGDLQWGLEQLRKLVDYAECSIVFECFYYFYKFLETSKLKLDIDKFQDIYVSLLNYPESYSDSERIVPRIGRKIYKMLKG